MPAASNRANACQQCLYEFRKAVGQVPLQQDNIRTARASATGTARTSGGRAGPVPRGAPAGAGADQNHRDKPQSKPSSTQEEKQKQKREQERKRTLEEEQLTQKTLREEDRKEEEKKRPLAWSADADRRLLELVDEDGPAAGSNR